MPSLTVYLQHDLYAEAMKRGNPSKDIQEALRNYYKLKTKKTRSQVSKTEKQTSGGD